MSEQSNAPTPDSTIDEEISQEQTAQAQPTQPVQPQTPSSSPKKFKLKIDGQELEEEFDPSNEAELVKRLQLAKVSQKRMAEAAEYKKNLEEAETLVANFLEQLKADPLAVLKNEEFGIDLKSVYERLMKEEQERASKTPEQLELEKYRAEVERLQKEKEEIENEKKRQEQERQNAEAAEQLERSVTEAIEKGELPKSKYITAKMMDLAHIAYSNGINIPIAELIPVAKKMYMDDMKDMLGKLPDDVVEEILTQDRIKTIRGKRIAELRKNSIPTVKVEDTGKKENKNTEAQREKTSDFFKKLGV